MFYLVAERAVKRMNILITIVISILLGLVPEVTYFTLFLIYTKDIKEKRIKLWMLIATAYILCMFIQKYKVIYYILFIVLTYFILKLLYKKKAQIIDIFVFSLAFNYVCIISYFCFLFLNKDLSNYYVLFALSRIVLFLPFVFKNKFRIVYKKYCNLWNRNDKECRPIKSITLRNISLISLNIFIILMDLACIYILNIVR